MLVVWNHRNACNSYLSLRCLFFFETILQWLVTLHLSVVLTCWLLRLLFDGLQEWCCHFSAPSLWHGGSSRLLTGPWRSLQEDRTRPVGESSWIAVPLSSCWISAKHVLQYVTILLSRFSGNYQYLLYSICFCGSGWLSQQYYFVLLWFSMLIPPKLDNLFLLSHMLNTFFNCVYPYSYGGVCSTLNSFYSSY